MAKISSQRVIIEREGDIDLEMRFSKEQLSGLGRRLLVDISESGIYIGRAL